MFEDELKSKMTPAAKQVLQEVLDDYQREILMLASKSASRITGEVSEIAVHDVVQGLKEARGQLLRTRPSMVERLLLIYAFVGVIAAVSGFMYFALLNVRQRIDYEYFLPLAVSMAGVLFSVLSIVVLIMRRRLRGFGAVYLTRQPSESEEGARIIILWGEIERRLRALAASRLGESIAERPLSALIKQLVEKSILDPRMANEIQLLLNMRNRVAHGGRPLETAELSSSLRSFEKLTEKLDGLNQGTSVVQ
jgi:hypothetical protein